ncbi:MAG TPA: PH domain-containing protein [Pyrinomonadaceae bacterium]|nr:PH domain-containing protein [Pyrinomonadaceae bacterium]
MPTRPVRIEEMDFKPRRLFAFVMGTFVSVVFGAFLLLFAVNIYRELREPTTSLDRWGWIGGGLVILSLALLLLHVITLPFRISFAEDGVRVRSIFGRRFVAWPDVRGATIAAHRGNVSFMLRTGRVRGVNIPLGSYKRAVSLVREVAKRLPVPVNVLPTAAHMIAKDDD